MNIATSSGIVPVLTWVKDHKHRNFATFDSGKQLDYAKKIAAIDDPNARKLMLSLLGDAAYLQGVIEEMHREFDTLHRALSNGGAS